MAAYAQDIIAWCQQVPTNEVRVRYKSDLPAAVGGVIPLDPNTAYKITGLIQLGTDVIGGSTIVLVSDPITTVGLVTTSASPLLSSDGTGGLCYVSGLQLINLGSGGLFDFETNPAIQPAASTVNASFLQSSGPIGTFRGGGLARLFDSGAVSLTGVTYQGNLTAEVHACALNAIPGAPSYTALTVDATANASSFRVSSTTFRAAQASDRAANVSGSATFASPMTFNDNTFSGFSAVFDAAGLDQTDPDVVARINTGLPDSLFSARASFAGNVLVTTFLTGDYVGVGNGTPLHPLYALNPLSERFTLDGGTTDVQVLTCAAVEPHTYLARSVVNVFKSGTATDVNFALFKNGTILSSSMVTVEVSATKKSVVVEALVALANGDTLQLKCANAALSNITVQAASIGANRV